MSRFKVLGSGLMVIACAASLLAQSGTVNWPLHNLDLAGGRFSAMDQITAANVATLTPRWLFQTGVIDGVSNQTTPVIVDGSMYVTDPRGSVYALDAADGRLLWTFDVTDLIGGGDSGYLPPPRRLLRDGVDHRGGSFLFALDVNRNDRTFGKDGQASVILDVIKLPLTRHRRMRSATGSPPRPTIHRGVIYISTRGSHRADTSWRWTPGRQMLWHFNTIPQGCRDQGWALAGPTWVGSRRNSGRSGRRRLIDPIEPDYVAVGNPFGDSAAVGTNLFTDSISRSRSTPGR
jgi:outer membrane protein assembly factor BamB